MADRDLNIDTGPRRKPRPEPERRVAEPEYVSPTTPPKPNRPSSRRLFMLALQIYTFCSAWGSIVSFNSGEFISGPVTCVGVGLVGLAILSEMPARDA